MYVFYFPGMELFRSRVIFLIDRYNLITEAGHKPFHRIIHHPVQQRRPFIKVESMPPVIMAMIVVTFFGELFQLERRVRSGLHGALERVPISTDRIDMDEYVTIVAIFCASGFGIYGVLMEGMSGESSILLSKAVMDLFTALIFAGAMGAAVSLAAVPQLIVFLIVFGLSKLVVPLTTPELLNDFMACGGILTVAAGLRVSKIKDSPIINMLPALIFVMPFSSLWGMVF